MAVVKGTGTAVIASTVSTTTSSAFSASGDYATDLYVSIVQVATATTAATVQIKISPDGGTTYYAPPTLLLTAGLAAGTYNWVISLPPSATEYQVTFTTQTGGTSSTCVVQSNDVTGI
jgi:hypothetical protein